MFDAARLLTTVTPCKSFWKCFIFASVLLAGAPTASRGQELNEPETISFAREIRPIFQANCFGCHQGARKNGDYDMTSFDGLLAGGASGLVAIAAGDPEGSYLVEMITPVDGSAEMPPDKPHLAQADIDKIATWIEQGAVNDSPPRPRYDQQHPPTYSRPPVITSLDFSPDGQQLAVSGLSEVILIDTASRQVAARLIGMSPRIESIRYSPDGKFLAVAAGMPGEFGELQIWNSQSLEQVRSHVVTHDTLFGVSWSPDSQTVAFGSADTAIRAIDRDSGEQVLYQNAHEDWVRDTAFSVDGTHLVSVARDMTCKLTEVAEQRFVDNVTSITPGVLKGGIAAVARHPQRDEILIGGADGVAKVYRMFRLTKRVIGDDANLIRKMPAVEGRIQAVGVSLDGRRIAVGSSLDRRGSVRIYSYEFDTSLPDDIRAIMSKVVTQRTAEENQKLDEYSSRDVQQVSAVELPECGVYALAFDPSGEQIALGGTDGQIRLVQTETGKMLASVEAFEIQSSDAEAQAVNSWRFDISDEINSGSREADVPLDSQFTAIKVLPDAVQLNRPSDYAQLIVQATTADGKTFDVTEQAHIDYDQSLVEISPQKLIQPLQAGSAPARVRLGELEFELPIQVDFATAHEINFRQDVAPILSRVGCNAGTCHGSASGKNGFQLSLRGYDPLFDVRALTDDLSSRRVNLASPDNSLMLLKPSATVPHGGGQVLDRHHKYYSMVRQWIANGARFDVDDPQVESIDIAPTNPVLWPAHPTQQFHVIARFSDGSTRDVTREAFVESADTETAQANARGQVRGLRRGEAAIIARYEGAFAATTLTVMGERPPLEWQEPVAFNEVDRLVAAKWQRMQIQPAPLTSDYEFIRRAYLDLTGLPPTSDEVRKFVADQSDTQSKRDALIDQLLSGESFVDHWTNKWADLLLVNRKYLGPEGAAGFRKWIRQQVQDNVPYDEFVNSLLTASGSNKTNPPASYFKILRSPAEIMENTTHLFLATRFNCNKCHDHPFERWTQDQYYETAAFFAQVGLKIDPESKDRKIGGTAVESAKPLFEIIFDQDSGEVTHDRTGQVTPPEFPFDCDFTAPDDATRRQRFANWLTSADNPYFAKSYVNRLWGYLLGRGLIEPIDDIRAGNPPTNPQLLEYLTDEFVQSGFNTRHIIQLICKSRTYQLSIKTGPYNVDDSLNYSHAVARRLPAETLFDAIHFSLGSQTMIPGYDKGIRAAELPDAGARLPSGFLATLGRPPRESVCECDRSNDLQLGSVLALVSGPDVARAIGDSANDLPRLVAEIEDDRQLIDELYMRVLSRPASDTEIELALDSFQQIDADHQQLIQQRDERAKWFESTLPELEKQREQAVQQAQQDLDQYVQKIDPELPAREKARADKMAAAQAALQTYEGDKEQRFSAWREEQLAHVQWHPLTPRSINQTSGAASELLGDRSIRVNENKGNTLTEVIAETDLLAVSAVRLEVLADPQLPGGGPGLADNGNFVLTEFQLEVASRNEPEQWKPIKLTSAISDFDQATYPITRAIDGNLGDGNGQGWAIVPQTQKSHWATFQLDLPVGFKDGTRLRFKLHQNYGFDKKHQLGRFRISISTAAQPVGLSVSEELLTTLIQQPDQWSEEQRKYFNALFQRGDQRLLTLRRNLNEAKKPLKIDAGIVERRAALERVSRPVPRDAALVQLENDAQQSEKQLGNRRLTAVQDLVWALVNSPSFLFNR